MSSPTTDYARWFRGSTPYISAHRNKTFVVLIPGEAIGHAQLTHIVHDLALLHVLGVRLVLVHGARPQIDAALPDAQFHAGRRITDASGIQSIAGIHGQIRMQLEMLFSTGLPNTPLHNVDVSVVSGNFVQAQPLGVLAGVDHLFTGRARNVDATRIQALLDAGAMVLQSPLGFSSSGQAFNIGAEELATEVALGINADKLIVLDEGILTDANGRVSSVTPASLDEYLAEVPPSKHRRLQAMARAVRGGIAKAHLIDFTVDGALLAELFTAQGSGTQMLEQQSRPVRRAQPADVAAIVEMIRPLEEQGILVRRERDRLEQEVDHFLVAELDGVVVGCCAVYPVDAQAAELACVAVHENFRKPNGNGIGSSLLEAAQAHALALNFARLFVLTTQTADWFVERGFSYANVAELPEQKRALYNWQRNAKVLSKQISN